MPEHEPPADAVVPPLSPESVEAAFRRVMQERMKDWSREQIFILLTDWRRVTDLCDLVQAVSQETGAPLGDVYQAANRIAAELRLQRKMRHRQDAAASEEQTTIAEKGTSIPGEEG